MARRGRCLKASRDVADQGDVLPCRTVGGHRNEHGRKSSGRRNAGRVDRPSHARRRREYVAWATQPDTHCGAGGDCGTRRVRSSSQPWHAVVWRVATTAPMQTRRTPGVPPDAHDGRLDTASGTRQPRWSCQPPRILHSSLSGASLLRVLLCTESACFAARVRRCLIAEAQYCHRMGPSIGDSVKTGLKRMRGDLALKQSERLLLREMQTLRRSVEADLQRISARIDAALTPRPRLRRMPDRSPWRIRAPATCSPIPTPGWSPRRWRWSNETCAQT